MPQTNSFLSEAIAAGYGVFGLLTGDRAVRSHFNATGQGLLGSFIALLMVVGLLCSTASPRWGSPSCCNWAVR